MTQKMITVQYSKTDTYLARSTLSDCIDFVELCISFNLMYNTGPTYAISYVWRYGHCGHLYTLFSLSQNLLHVGQLAQNINSSFRQHKLK